MVFEAKFDSFNEIAEVQKLAMAVEEPVFFESEDENIHIDAKSFIGLFVLDFSKPVKVVTDSLYVIRRLELASRAKLTARKA
ncbi:hypothetical protein [Lawsonibacter faecis]|uniref:Uncharacterized protein n=1 Tax=Lawsonibacter faecis TaxID=2763052 RepID=A0A8J6JJY3_9FIRM|nr:MULTISPECIES: hypothetical protein [Oscillospiraceae]MTQ95979.1 hypothetical protein [Pseudoflavonifractor sp. BIOML-A16]MTR04731.1 hypothetical protein [Pseudoflavonifractor sp. BIOML-A15]MTR31021.1 hypothetical protein [Pseudoflavonifractor sp. BIOML-A14]MTR71586.1 hypothetical protein [Pseudoflavonifractor sp. BIOML-A18]MTS62871.1 hypothetical protein [Pseudoflavonifractor sp. BIOML-A5]MTS71535.1 hypothetical protein [Pseudoflavonifractor sp. BIOML-A8]MTS91133.1 hypothetical protein [P